MKQARYTIDQILSMSRPASYLEELKACAITSDETSLTFDLEGECFKTMKAKYAGYEPTREEIERAEAHKIESARKNAVLASSAAQSQTQAQRMSPAGALVRTGGCGGCKGRKSVK